MIKIMTFPHADAQGNPTNILNTVSWRTFKDGCNNCHLLIFFYCLSDYMVMIYYWLGCICAVICKQHLLLDFGLSIDHLLCLVFLAAFETLSWWFLPHCHGNNYIVMEFNIKISWFENDLIGISADNVSWSKTISVGVHNNCTQLCVKSWFVISNIKGSFMKSIIVLCRICFSVHYFWQVLQPWLQII